MSATLALSRRLRIAACVGALLAAACGGGGGDGPAPAQLLQITPQNELAVARATAETFVSLSGVGDVPLSGAASADPTSNIAKATKRALGAAIGTDVGSGKTRPLTVHSMTERCPMGGSMTLDFDDRDNNDMPSGGDTMSLAFDQCRMEETMHAYGKLVIGVGSYSETPNSVQLNGTFRFENLVVDDGVHPTSANGETNAIYTETLDVSGAQVRFEMTVASGGFVASHKDSFTYDEGFRLVSTEFMPAGTSQMAHSTTMMNGTVHVASLGGRIRIATDASTPVHEWMDQPYPDSGLVVVHGQQSQLRMTVMNTTTVHMELDANGDGAFEKSTDVAWAELMP